MATLKDILDRAAGEGLVAADKVLPLEALLVRQGVRVAAAPLAGFEPDDADEVVDTEAPRFIRGFHDVLITIGVLILLSGIWGLWSGLALLPFILVLSEILIVRQRLALPAVILSLALTVWTAIAAASGVEAIGVDDNGPAWIFAMLLPFPFVLGLFYWRYRVPIALAILILSVCAFLLAGLITLLGRLTGTDDFAVTYPTVTSLIFLASAILLFAVAMRYDMADPSRLTRRSDIAFWLHLTAAPALLYGMLAVVFLRKAGHGGLFSLDGLPAYESAGQVLVIVVILMAIGLIIDRRAFVTSGLISLIAAVGSILSRGTLDGRGTVFIALLIVGVVVLTIGVGWPKLRRLVVGLFPEGLKAKLPPLR
jgi:hypothetical protein